MPFLKIRFNLFSPRHLTTTTMNRGLDTFVSLEPLIVFFLSFSIRFTVHTMTTTIVALKERLEMCLHLESLVSFFVITSLFKSLLTYNYIDILYAYSHHHHLSARWLQQWQQGNKMAVAARDLRHNMSWAPRFFFFHFFFITYTNFLFVYRCSFYCTTATTILKIKQQHLVLVSSTMRDMMTQSWKHKRLLMRFMIWSITASQNSHCLSEEEGWAWRWVALLLWTSQNGEAEQVSRC